MSANVQHLSGTNEAYTPPIVVEAARRCMGAIDLDPFSCAAANKVVKASTYFSELALDRDWCMPNGTPARVFCNPPGGTLDRETLEPSIRPDGKPGPGYSSAAVAWHTLVDQYLAGKVSAAIFVCFSLNTFQNSQQIPGGRFAPYMFPFCVPRRRLKFWCEDRPIDVKGTKNQPSQPNALIYLGDDPTAFEREFEHLGKVRL